MRAEHVEPHQVERQPECRHQQRIEHGDHKREERERGVRERRLDRLISDIWGIRGATYGEKAVCRRIKKTKKEN